MSEPSSSTDHVANDQKPETPPAPAKSPLNPALSCEMCQNYELSLTIIQDRERKMKEELASATTVAQKFESDLSREQEYRKDLEKKMTELAEQTNCKVQDAVKMNQQLELKLNELKLKHEKSIEACSEQLTLAQKTIEEKEVEMAEFLEKYNRLLGQNRKNAQELRSEPIDLPDQVDQLQFLCLKTREELIEVNSAKEHVEQNLNDEIAMLREQLKEERSARKSRERELFNQISHLETELGISNSKVSSTADALAQHEANQRKIRELQSTVSELETQVELVQKERAAIETTCQNYKQRCLSLQQELETMEHVQKDFVKLSQSLQIELEKIRQSELEVRWQWDEDVESCSNCSTSLVKLKSKPHCMHCGKIFCVTCIDNTVISGPNRREAKVCHVCHTLLKPESKPFFATKDDEMQPAK